MQKDFYELLSGHFGVMSATGMLFRADIAGDEIYDLYLQSFPAGADPVFRDPNSTEHSCNNCKNFMRRYGNYERCNKKQDVFRLGVAENHKHEGRGAGSSRGTTRQQGAQRENLWTYREERR